MAVYCPNGWLNDARDVDKWSSWSLCVTVRALSVNNNNNNIFQHQSSYYAHLQIGPKFKSIIYGPRWSNGYTLASHLWGLWFKPLTLLRKVGSFFRYSAVRNHTNCMYWFPLPIKQPAMTYTVLKVMLKPK